MLQRSPWRLISTAATAFRSKRPDSWTAWALEIGQGFDVDPLLILSVAATESSFNPKAKNGSGAEAHAGHDQRAYKRNSSFGGAKAAMEPYPNMVVGASILARLIDRTGSVSQGLKHYYGAGNQSSDNGYAAKVFKERSRLQVAAAGDSDRAVELSRANRTGPAYNAKHRPRNLGYGEWMQLLETRAQQGGSVKRLAPESDAVAENRRSSDSAEGSSTES